MTAIHEPDPLRGAARLVRGACLPSLFVAATLLGACRTVEEAIPLRLAAGTPVILISIDTLRADRLPAYGYSEGVTPAIDALRRDSILFERAYSHVPLTLPSHVSLFTGLLPGEHGVRDNLGSILEPEGFPYLPRLLRDAGYATAAAVSAYALPASAGLDEGFDLYDDEFSWQAGTGLGEVQRSGRDTLSRLTPWLEGVASVPFFVFFHLYEPHSPYTPPEPWASTAASPYDGEISAADAAVGELVDNLRALGVYDRALLLLLSDHGEGLGDHGEREHGLLLYREALHVPLLVKLPAGRDGGSTVTEPVQLIDVVPTVTELLGLDVDYELRGRNLLSPAARADRPILSETFYPRTYFGWSELLSVIRGDRHYILAPTAELFDMVGDPAESHNLMATEGAAGRSLRADLRDYDGRWQEPGAVSEDRRRVLESLGYLSSATAATDGPLADPKDRIHTLEDLMRGFEHYHSGAFEEAATAFSLALEQNPGMVHAWEYLARSQHHAGLRSEALESYLTTLRLGATSPRNTAPAAALMIESGRIDDALRLLSEQIRRTPSSRRLRSVEIRALMAAERYREASDRAESLVELAAEEPAALYQRAVARMMVGDLEGAELDFRATLQRAPDNVEALHDLGVLLEHQGRLEDAADLFRRVLAVEPDHPIARRGLERLTEEV